MRPPIRFGYYGTRASDTMLPTPGPMTRQQITGWYGTALNTYIPYGMTRAASWDTYVRVANECIALVQASEPVKLLLELPGILWDQLRAGNTQLAMTWLADANERWGVVTGQDREPRVLGFYADEPNHPSKNIPAETLARARAALTKDLAVVVCPNGSRDPFDPMAVPLKRADQSTHDILSRCVAQIGGFCYPLETGSSEWSRIERLQNVDQYDGSLRYCQRNSGGVPFIFAVQTHEEQAGKRMPLVRTLSREGTWAHGRVWSDELCWMVHRAMFAGAGTIMFFSWNRADDLRHQAVWNLCRLVDSEAANRIIASRVLASSEAANEAWCRPLLQAAVHYSYHFWNGHFWLLVMDSTPSAATSRPQALRFHCRTLAPPAAVQNRYGLEQPDGPDTAVAASWSEATGCVTLEAAEQPDRDDRLKRGEVRLYKLAQQL